MSLRLPSGKPVLGLVAVGVLGMSIAACANATSDATLSYAKGPPEQRLYRLGAGDKLKITVFGEDNLSGQFEVSPTGGVGIALAGEIQAKGLTVQEFRDAVASKLLREGILKHPKVAVDVLNYRPIYVHGEVKTGGEFQYKSGLRLRDAVAMAGGYTYRADQSYILLGRDDQGEKQVNMPGDAFVLPGDNIRIPERFF